jgi:hypothetical protein
LGPTGFYEVDIRAPLPPGAGKVWAPIYVWADMIYGPPSMGIALAPDEQYVPSPDRVYSLELLHVPDGVVGAPPEGTVWQVPIDGLFTVSMPTYRTFDGRTSYQFAFRASPAVNPCAGTLPGDANCDNVVSWRDIDAFVAALDGEEVWRQSVGGAASCGYLCVNDIDRDGRVDWRDIDLFLLCLSGGCPE